MEENNDKHFGNVVAKLSDEIEKNQTYKDFITEVQVSLNPVVGLTITC